MRNVRSSKLSCGFRENDLIAEALGEAPSHLSLRIRTHLLACDPCRELLKQYRLLRTQLQVLSPTESNDRELREARRALDLRLSPPQRPRLFVELWHSPVGDMQIGKTEKGIALVEFLRPDKTFSIAARLQETFAIEKGGAEVAAVITRLEEYFSGRRHDLEWIVDDSLMRSDFQRQVLHATVAVPYGTVVTYQGIAETIGQPKAVRAVAQALRYNPIPIHIPCHRVIGSDGSLTGYAGNLVEIKKQILAVEGIPVVETTKGLAIPKQQMYVGWRHDRCFCRPDCASLQDQPAGDRAFIPSRVRAEAVGYVPCDVCHPELHPL